MKLAALERLRAARAAHEPVVLVTHLDGSSTEVYSRADIPPALAEACATALRTDEAQTLEGVFVEPHNPPVRVVIVGAVHVAQPLAQMAERAGFVVIIVDPRRSWATPERFPGQVLVTEWPDVALDGLALDARSAVVTLTHDPKLDDPALISALRSPAFYIGCLGSQKTAAARRERLAAAGFTAEQLARLHGPVGLRIGAKSPAEIAVSILAEVIATLRGGA